MWMVDEKSGVQSGYYAKMLYAETPSGRAARWTTLQWVIDALWPGGIGMVLRGEAISDDETMRTKIAALQRQERRRRRGQAQTTRTHLRTYASAKEARP